MKIACLGWGSLIWRPESLQIKGKWFDDGPILPIEFTRQSDNKRITLIIDEEASPVRSLWALMTSDSIESAVQSLKDREGKKSIIDSIKKTDKDNSTIKETIIQWLQEKNLDAAVWTALTYSNHTDNKRPSIDYVINHLRELDYNTRKVAEEYIRRTPKQIDTDYRRKIEFELGWTHLD